MKQQPSGIRVGQMRVPIGVFGMIYESRPNVTIEAASLASRAATPASCAAAPRPSIPTRRWPAGAAGAGRGRPAARRGATGADHRPRGRGPAHCHAAVVDVIIPRGGKGLIERISRDAKVPVIKHLDGNCHTYVDDPCDIAMAVKVADNAKTRSTAPATPAKPAGGARRGGRVFAADRRGVCRQGRGDARLPRVAGDAAIGGGCQAGAATEQDWSEEYLAPIISVKVVAGVDEAIAHINRYGSHHTDAILTTTTCTPSASCARWIRPA
jgi:glutamate-5-semialdehyde dehydrogenase